MRNNVQFLNTTTLELNENLANRHKHVSSLSLGGSPNPKDTWKKSLTLAAVTEFQQSRQPLCHQLCKCINKVSNFRIVFYEQPMYITLSSVLLNCISKLLTLVIASVLLHCILKCLNWKSSKSFLYTNRSFTLSTILKEVIHGQSHTFNIGGCSIATFTTSTLCD